MVPKRGEEMEVEEERGSGGRVGWGWDVDMGLGRESKGWMERRERHSSTSHGSLFTSHGDHLSFPSLPMLLPLLLVAATAASASHLSYQEETSLLRAGLPQIGLFKALTDERIGKEEIKLEEFVAGNEE